MELMVIGLESPGASAVLVLGMKIFFVSLSGTGMMPHHRMRLYNIQRVLGPRSLNRSALIPSGPGDEPIAGSVFEISLTVRGDHSASRFCPRL